jgi:hypothetical protein
MGRQARTIDFSIFHNFIEIARRLFYYGSCDEKAKKMGSKEYFYYHFFSFQLIAG